MASYEIEHNVPPASSQTGANNGDNGSSRARPSRRPRPDLSTFFASLEQVDTSSVQNPHAVPTPGMAAAVYRNGLEGMAAMMHDNPDRALPDQIVAMLSEMIEAPPKEVKGVGDEFLADLDRVPKKKLKKSDACPICGVPFLEDEYPLVVQLPCHKDHIFDMDCIAPWLKMNSTCPLDRKDFLKKKTPPPPPDDDEEEEYDDMYA